MADEKPIIDEDAHLAVATLIVEALVSVEAASVGVEMLVTREGQTPELTVAGRRLAQAEEALAGVDQLLRNATTTPEADANG